MVECTVITNIPTQAMILELKRYPSGQAEHLVLLPQCWTGHSFTPVNCSAMLIGYDYSYTYYTVVYFHILPEWDLSQYL